MQHLDEGTIHAWLDGELTADEAARLGRHVRECGECAALVAEARGLMAGASRILSALDDVESVVPGAGSAQRPAKERARPAFLRQPRWLAAAAAVIVMAGSAIVLNKSGGRESLGVGFSDSAFQVSAPMTEADARTAGVADTAPTPSDAPRVLAGGDGRGAGTAVAANRSAGSTAPTREQVAIGSTPPAPPPAPPSEQLERAERQQTQEPLVELPRTPVGEIASAIVADSRSGRERVAPSAAAPTAQKRAAARSESRVDASAAPAPPAARTAAPSAAAADMAVGQRPARVDTVYERGRVDTVVVDRPGLPELRQPGVTRVERAYPITGCYRVVEGLAADSLMLTTNRAWSGYAEQRFVATAPGAIGYWSQPRTGDLHIVIGGALVTARVDQATGELRGRVRRGGPSERFLARRCR